MSSNNFNNKFGLCCGCPALTTGGIMFTDWRSSRMANNDDKLKYNTLDSHSYRTFLQSNSDSIMTKNIVKFEQSRCNSSNENKFYIDSSNWKPDQPLTNVYSGMSTINDGSKRQEYAKFDNTHGEQIQKKDKYLIK